MIFKIAVGIVFLFFTLFDSVAQSNKSILTNVDIQIEATAAINKMYNFEFKEAEKEFNWLVQEYGDHPLPVFLKGLSLWWKIDSYSGISDLSKTDSLDRLDEKFIKIMDKAISLSQNIYEKGNKIDGAFFLAASYGFKGRLLSERRKWRASALAGMNALRYLKEIRKDDLMIPEISFGNGLFNYYSVWISERYPLLKPIIKLFPDGDKQKGIVQLNNAGNNSFYTRTEAQYFLTRIYSSENDIRKALYLSKYLFETFPDNSIFHKFYNQLLYRSSSFSLCEMQSLKIIENFNKKKKGYYDNDIRLAHFFLGEIYLSKKDNDLAIHHLNKSLFYSEKFKNQKLGYTIYSNFLLGKIHFDRGEINKSKFHFKKVIKLTKRKDDLNQKSKGYIKKI
tara:strand:- start:4594 stop:5772 length:1179 start_codon:yes stop_codon:yes gene_type:complete